MFSLVKGESGKQLQAMLKSFSPSNDGGMGSGSGIGPCNVGGFCSTPLKEDVQKSVVDPMTELQIQEGKKLKNVCELCLETTDHMWCVCPYLKGIPEEAADRIGPGFDIACNMCYQYKDEHDDEYCDSNWFRRAIRKSCINCGSLGGHWSKECKKPPVKTDFSKYSYLFSSLPKHVPLEELDAEQREEVEADLRAAEILSDDEY